MRDETMLNAAVKAMRADEPEAAEVAVSARRVAARLGLEAPVAPRIAVDWAAPSRARGFMWNPQRFGWGAALACAAMACGLLAYRAYWQVPPGVRAEVQSIDGAAYSISETGGRQLAPGDGLREGEHLRTSGGSHAVLRLADGSTVEVNERSVLAVGARGHDVTLSLDDGAVIVQATKRVAGHMYVRTPDCRVAVTGTVFSVNSGIKGSRVAVLQGTVEVSHAGVDTWVNAGDQVATNDNLSPAPVEQQISWSHDRGKYLLLLAQFSTLEHRIEQIPFPQARYSSDLLGRMPANTLLYVSIPNLGDFLSSANAVFDDQLKQSPELQQWWGNGKNRNAAELDSLVQKLHDMSQYLGDEVVVAGMKQPGNGPGFAVVADLNKAGLDDYLRQHFGASGMSHGIVVVDESALSSLSASTAAPMGEYALVRRHEVVFSNSVATLKQMNVQLDAGASGFAATDFGAQITAAYGRGAGIILAANLHAMIQADAASGLPSGLASGTNKSRSIAAESGMDGVSYLIAEHRETNGQPENHLNLQFLGPREHLASWLGAPAPIGSLDFVTPNAAVAAAVLSKDPKAIADDMMSIARVGGGTPDQDLSTAEAELHINFRDELAANLGGDFLLSLDGPVLPTPAWKAVVEVHNADGMEQTLEKLAAWSRDVRSGEQAGPHGIAIEASEAGGQRYYAIHQVNTGTSVAEYTFADGYMILAANRALLMEALRTHASGNSLAHSTAFKALLPKDENENYSAVAYQNLSPVLTPLLSQFSGQQAKAIQQLAADARPTAVCAWGKDTRIEAASNSHLLGFDFLTLGALLDRGNKPADASVKE